MKVLNPETHHGITVDGVTFCRMLDKGYLYDKEKNILYKPGFEDYSYITNPETMKRISVGSPIFISLLKKGYVHDIINNIFLKDGKPAIDPEKYVINPQTGFAVLKEYPTFKKLHRRYGYDASTNKLFIKDSDKIDKYRFYDYEESESEDVWFSDSGDEFDVDEAMVNEFLFDGDIEL